MVLEELLLMHRAVFWQLWDRLCLRGFELLQQVYALLPSNKMNQIRFHYSACCSSDFYQSGSRFSSLYPSVCLAGLRSPSRLVCRPIACPSAKTAPHRYVWILELALTMKMRRPFQLLDSNIVWLINFLWFRWMCLNLCFNSICSTCFLNPYQWNLLSQLLHWEQLSALQEHWGLNSRNCHQLWLASFLCAGQEDSPNPVFVLRRFDRRCSFERRHQVEKIVCSNCWLL